MSTASSVQVAQYGIDNKYIQGEPSMTFFKSVIKKHTNYSTEAMAVNFDTPPKMGFVNTITIPRNGDLVRRVHIKVYYPEILFTGTDDFVYKWCSCVAQALVEYAELYIGGELIQKITDIEGFIQSELRTPDSHYPALQVLENRFPVAGSNAVQTEQLYSFPSSGTFYTSLYFYFHWHESCAIPLCALKYQDVKIRLKFRDIKEMVQTYDHTIPSRGEPKPPAAEDPNRRDYILSAETENNMKFTPCVEYVFLDDIERQRFMSGKQIDTIIEQNQRATFNSGMTLPFTGIVKELILTIQSKINWHQVETQWGNNYYNFYRGLNPADPYSNLWARYITLSFNHEIIIQDDLTAITGSGYHTFDYFKYVQPLKYHTRVSGMNFFEWTFAQDPESLNPTGGANFSRIRSNVMTINTTTGDLMMDIYATSLNIYRICDGIGALLFKE